MPPSSEPREERIRLLNEQFEQFLSSETLKEYLAILDIRSTDPKDILREMETYNTRKGADGLIYESQTAPLNAVLEANKPELFPIYDEMGLVSVNKPLPGDDFDKIIVLGGSANANYNRTAAVAGYLNENVGEVAALSCFRPIPQKERKNCSHPGPFETEVGAMHFAFTSLFELTEEPELESGNYPRNLNLAENIRTYHDESGRKYRIFASPSQTDTERPGTYDTIVHYLSNIGDGNAHRMLVITNNQYCNYQFIPFALALLECGRDNIDFDIVGCSDDDHLISPEKYNTNQFFGDIKSEIEWIINFRKSLIEG